MSADERPTEPTPDVLMRWWRYLADGQVDRVMAEIEHVLDGIR